MNEQDELIKIFIAIAFFAFVIIFLSLTSCRAVKPIVQEKIKEVHTETIVRDTIVTIAADTAQARLLLECDSAGNVMLREIEQLHGDRLSLQTNLKRLQNVTGSPVVVDITCKEDSLQRIIDIQSKRIKELKAEKITETRLERYIPNFYKVSTLVLWVFVASAVLYFVIRLIIKIYLHK